jgi:hypothetical protein
VPSVRIRRGEIAFAAEAGAPVGPAEGTIELRSWRSRQSLALAEAEPALELCPGPYWCIARDVRGQATRAARVEVRSGERAIFDPGRQDGCSLSGRVSGSRVRPGIDEVRLSWLSGLGYQRRTIDGEGRFTFGDLAPGRYSASLAGLGTIRVDLEAGESAEVEVDVPELVSMAVEGPEGAIGELLGASLVPLGPQDEPVEVLLPCQVDPSRSRLLVPVPAGAALVLVQHVAESGPRTSYAVLDGGAHERVIRLGRGAVAIEAASEHGRAPELRLTGVGGWPWKGECPIAGARRGSSWWFDGIPTGGRTRVGPRIGALAPHVAFVTPGVLVE